VWLVLLAWVGIYLALMQNGGWPWRGQGIFGFGVPRPLSLRRFGAVVPAALTWRSFLTSPWLPRSLLGLVFLLGFWNAVGRTVSALVGGAWTWVLFVAGGAAGVLGHVLAHPHDTAVGGCGPFDPVLAALGVQLAWGLTHRGPQARRLVLGALGMLLFVALLTWAFAGDALRVPQGRAQIGVEASVGATLAGLGLGLLLALARRLAPRGTARTGRVAAGVLLLAVLGAGVAQGRGVVAASEGDRAGRFLNTLQAAERAAETVWDQSEATPERRARLLEALARVEAEPFLDGFAGRAALDDYVHALARYTRPVDATWDAEADVRKAFRTWVERWERPLRRRLGLDAGLDPLWGTR
jgi:membrane associated rhomboid family serine protease